MLPPTSSELHDRNPRPYFLWWCGATVGEFRAHIASPDGDERAYWVGALMREANTRDVWSFVDADQLRALWPKLQRHLGRSRAMWAYLLGLDLPPWPPPEAFREDVRVLVREIPAIARECGAELRVVRDAGTFVRATARIADHVLEIDIVHEALADIEPPPAPVEGVVVESFVDLRAAKLTCLLSRAEPRDLVDLLFLDRAGYPMENDLTYALRKDAGIDPGVLAWLLRDFPTAPLPRMIVPLKEEELVRFRTELAERFRRIAVP